MAVHERFLHLAATAVTEDLAPRDAFSLANHVESCEDCRTAETRLTADHLRLRALVAEQPVGVAMRAAVLEAVDHRRASSTWRVLLVVGLLLLSLIAAAILVGRGPRTDLPPEFVGAWTTRNCATFWVHQRLVDCDRWGDDTTLRLEIPAEGRAVISVVGAGREICSGTASDKSILLPPWPGAGSFLLIRFEQTSCGFVGIGDDMTIDVYRGNGQDELWIDDDGDGWGLKWRRSG